MKNNIYKATEMRNAGLILILLVMVFASCVPGRELRMENRSVPVQFDGGTQDSLNSASITWRTFFSDPYLVALIDTALSSNQELNILLQQIDIAHNEISVRHGEYQPFVNYFAGGEVEKVGKYTRNGAVEENLHIKEGREFPEPLADFSLGVSASWELDVWKKLRTAEKSATLEYLSTIEGRNFMVTELVAEIADAYYELLALDNQLTILEQNLEIQQNALGMVRLQKEAARTTELAVRRFEAEVFKNQSNIFAIQQQRLETENKINFLIGRSPQPIARVPGEFVSLKVDTMFAGIPSQLLQNRPDIRQAEFELKAAKLNTEVARANFYPSFGIKAGIGLQAFNPKFLFSIPESVLFSLVGDVVGPLINRNAIEAEYQNANDRQLQAIFEYERTILNAYVEVANELSNISNLQKSYALKARQVQALTESIDLCIRLFQSARADYMEVLLTQREALDSKIEIIETKKAQMLANVCIYKALGGGWN